MLSGCHFACPDAPLATVRTSAARLKSFDDGVFRARAAQGGGALAYWAYVERRRRGDMRAVAPACAHGQ